MVSIFVLVSFKPGLFLSGENLIRYVVTPGKPETRWRFSSVAQILWSRFLAMRAR